MNLIGHTKLLLCEWGRESKDPGPCWPSQSAFVALLSGRGTGIKERSLPSHLLPIDAAIIHLEPQDKTVIVLHYTRHLTAVEKATQLGIQRRQFWNRLERATWAVHGLLD